MLRVGQDVPAQTGLLNCQRQADLVEVGPLGRQVERLIEGLRHRHPDLRKALAVRGPELFGEGKQTGGKVRHPPAALGLLHQPDAVCRHWHGGRRIDAGPDALLAPTHGCRWGQRHAAVLDDILNPVGPQRQNITVHEAGKFSVPRLQSRKNFVAMRIGRVKPTLGQHRPQIAAHLGQRRPHLRMHEVQLLRRTIADQRHRIAEILAERCSQITGHHLIIRRLHDEIDRQARHPGLIHPTTFAPDPLERRRQAGQG